MRVTCESISALVSNIAFIGRKTPLCAFDL